MFALNTRKLSTTLFISFAVLFAIATVAEASHGEPLQQRDHVNLKRMFKKRSPQILGGGDVPGPVIGAAPIPSGANETTSDAATTSPAITSPVTTLPDTTSLPITSGAPNATTSGDTTSGADSSTTSDTSTTTSTSSTTESPATTTTSVPQNNNADPVTSTTTEQIKSTRTVVTSVEETQTTTPQLSSAAAKTSSNIVTILVAVAASIGGVAILWTVFRKWKLGSSKRFEERMQPIDWKSPSHDDGLPSHRRTSGSSFNSSGRNNNLSPLPDHDFTATGNASPVGGYADMSRGPSMRETGNTYAFGSGISGGRY